MKVQSLNIWEYPNYDIEYRANTEEYWLPFGDTPEHYRKVLKTNTKHVTFSETDIVYRYNSEGFRSDEFKDVSILYAGCSNTEGVGLPLEYVWSSQMNKLIKDEFGYSGSYHSIARQGLSSTGIVRKIFWALEVRGLRPKILFALFPLVLRDEFFIQHFYNIPVVTDYIPNFTGNFKSHKERYFYENHVKNVRISNRINDFFKDLMFAKMICERHGVVFRAATWHRFLPMTDVIDQDLQFLDESYLSEYQGVSYVDILGLIKNNMPEFLNGVFNTSLYFNHTADFKVYPQTVARDFIHSGPNVHMKFARDYFNELKDDQSFLDGVNKCSTT